MKSKKVFAILLIVFTAIIISGCTRAGAASSWPGVSVSENMGFLSYGAQTFAIDLQNGGLVWQYPADPDRARQVYAAPAYDNGLVVVGDYNGVLIGLDQVNGSKKWEFNGAEDRYVASALVSNGRVFAPNTDHYLYALNESGYLEWKFQTNGPNWSKPVTDGEMVYLSSMDHTFYALKLDIDSRALSLADDGSKTLYPQATWKIDLGMAAIGNPVLADGVVYSATIEGILFAIDIDQGNILWSFDGGGELGAVWGEPIVTEDAVFVGDIKGNIFSINKSDGSAQWATPFAAGGRVIGGGTMTEDGVVFANDEGKLFRINTEKEPKTIAIFEAPIHSQLGTSGENIILATASEDSLLTAMDLNGFEVWSFLPSE